MANAKKPSQKKQNTSVKPKAAPKGGASKKQSGDQKKVTKDSLPTGVVMGPFQPVISPNLKDGLYNGIFPVELPLILPVGSTPCGGHYCGLPKEAHTSKSDKCTFCMRWDRLVTNSASKRKDGTIPGLEITKGEFVRWLWSQYRNCYFCGVPESELFKVGIYNPQSGRGVLRLGSDRLDNSKGYSLDNIAPCCFGCNSRKSSLWTTEEMLEESEVHARIVKARIDSYNERNH